MAPVDCGIFFQASICLTLIIKGKSSLSQIQVKSRRPSGANVSLLKECIYVDVVSKLAFVSMQINSAMETILHLNYAVTSVDEVFSSLNTKEMGK